MKKALAVCALLVLGIFAVLSWMDHRVQVNALRDSVAVAREARSLWQAKYAEASTTIQRDTLRLTKYLQRWDTVRLTIPDTAESDSVAWSEILPVIQLADSTIGACRDLLLSCAELEEAADSTIAAQQRASDFYVQSLQREIVGLKRQKFFSRFGLSCGYGVTKIGPDVKAGPQCGASIRVLP